MFAGVGSGKSQGGFVLVSVVGVSALMLILAGVFNFFAEQEIEGAIRAKKLLENKLDQKSTEQTLFYLFATHRFTRAGLSLAEEDEGDYIVDGDIETKPVGGEMLLDGTPYVGFGSTIYFIRDLNGTFPLNSMDPSHLENLLLSWEADAATRRGLVDSLLDYIDVDQIERLHGAEGPTDSVAPKNYLLRTVPEIRSVRGWARWLDSHPEFDPEALFSVNREAHVNINTLPAGHFRYLFSLSELELELVQEQREQFSFLSVDDVKKLSGEALALDELYFRFFPSTGLRFTIISPDSEYSSTMLVNFTPLGLKKPWHVEYQYFSELSRNLPESSARFKGKHFTDLSVPAAAGSLPVGG